MSKSAGATMSDCKDPENRSDKDCCCGSHSANDTKKNLNNHSTKQRYLIRLARKEKERGLIV